MSKPAVQFIEMVRAASAKPNVVKLDSQSELPPSLWYLRGDYEEPEVTAARLLRLYGVRPDVVYVVGIENWVPVCGQDEQLPKRRA